MTNLEQFSFLNKFKAEIATKTKKKKISKIKHKANKISDDLNLLYMCQGGKVGKLS